jgi:hypothetical protein
VRIDASQAPKIESAGLYVFVTHRWMVEGLQAKEQLYFAVAPLDGGTSLGDEAAERLIVRAATLGTDWPEARNVLDGPRAARIAQDLSEVAERQYRAFVQRMKDENNDRADLQIATLDRHFRNQTEKLEGVRQKHIEAGRANLAKATARQLELLTQSVALKRRKVEEGRRLDARHEEVSVGVLQVVGAQT